VPACLVSSRINAATCPRSKLFVGAVVTDAGSDGVTDLSAPIPALFAQVFPTGVDVFLPASAPPTGSHTLTLVSRGVGPARTLRFPDFPSSTDRVSVLLNDFESWARTSAQGVHREAAPWSRPPRTALPLSEP
jgi:hypothetical protein